MNDVINAVPLPEAQDARPEPPPMHDLYICRWWEWSMRYDKKGMEWGLRTSMFPQAELKTLEGEAQKLVAAGNRGVQIVCIPAQSQEKAR